MINFDGMVTGYAFAPANVDEREIAPEITPNIHRLLGADKDYLRPSLNEYYKFQYVNLRAPLRKNMLDLRSKESMRLLMKAR